jgi:hypothetical protein
VYAATTIGGRLFSATAPVDASGEYRLPVLPPGVYAIEVRVSSRANDYQAGLGRATVAAGARTRADLAIPGAVAMRIVTRPSIRGALVYVVPGNHAVRGWPALRAVLDRVPAASAIGTFAIAMRADGEVRVGDGVDLVGAPSAGPVTVCLLAGNASPDTTPFQVFRADPGAPPVRCVTATATTDAIATVVLPTSP